MTPCAVLVDPLSCLIGCSDFHEQNSMKFSVCTLYAIPKLDPNIDLENYDFGLL